MISDDAFGGPGTGPDSGYATGPGLEDYGLTQASPGTQALLDAAKKAAEGKKVDGWDPHGTDYEGEYSPLPSKTNWTRSKGYSSPEAKFARGETIINPKASFFDWITAPVELALNVGSRIATGGLLGLDVDFTGRDVTGIKGHTDVSQYGAGMRGPQAPGVQVDVGIPGVSGVLGPIAPDIGTISLDQTGVGFHSTFDPSRGVFGKAAKNVAADAVKGAASFYAGGGLASLPQITNSGLYRALGRG